METSKEAGWMAFLVEHPQFNLSNFIRGIFPEMPA